MAARSSAPVLGALCSTSNPSIDGTHGSSSSPCSTHHWSIAVGYRYQHSFRHFVGTEEQMQREELGTQVVNYINLFDVSVTYKFNPRRSLTVGLPLLNATRTYDHQLFDVFFHVPNAPDQVSHSNGIGDLSVSGQIWLLRPPAENGHNIAFSFGAVFPTGNHAAQDTVATVNGPQTVFVDQSVQPGAGGHGISLSTEAYQRVKRAVLYVSGSYLITPQESNGTHNASIAAVPLKPNPLTSTVSIPDQYLVDGGMAYPVSKVRGLAAKMGLRYNKNTWTVNIPVAVQRNRKRSVPDLMQGKAGDAAFADYLVLVGYSRSF